jgi:hypothetical protein
MSGLCNNFKVPIPSKPISSYTTRSDPYIFILAITLRLRNYIYLIGRISNLSAIAKYLNF